MNISHLTPTFSDIKTWVRAAAVSVNQLITGKQDKSDNLTSLSGLDLTGHSGDAVVVTAGEDGFELSPVSGGSGLSDGDYGDIVVSGTGTVLSFDTGVVTAFAKTFLDDANAGAVRTTIGAAATSHTHTQSDLTGLTTADSPQFTAINLGHASDTTLTRVSAGVVAIEGSNILTAATGQPLDTDLTSLSGLTLVQGDILYRDGSQLQRLAAGTAGAKLTTAGAGANPSWQGFRGCRAVSAGASGVNYSTATAMAFGSADQFDTDSIHDPVTNNTRLTVPSGVTFVSIDYSIEISAIAAGSMTSTWVRKGGSTNVGGGTTGETGGAVLPSKFGGTTGPLAVSGGDYFELMVQCVDTSVNISGSETFFSMTILQ